MSGYLCLLSLCPWVLGQKSHAEEAFVVSSGSHEHSEMRLPRGYRETTYTIFYTICYIAGSPIAAKPWGFKQGWLQKRSMGIGP